MPCTLGSQLPSNPFDADRAYRLAREVWRRATFVTCRLTAPRWSQRGVQNPDFLVIEALRALSRTYLAKALLVKNYLKESGLIGLEYTC